MIINEFTVEKLNDPTGILSGDRYEFFLTIVVDEEDDLSTEDSLQLKVLFLVEEEIKKVLNYHFYNSSQDKYLDFALDEEELAEIYTFCTEHYTEAN
ncbi:DUF6509 family protein [Niallia sp. 03133]|uniref:DUF6509 family protein n=1 Tax=Niallia sp. 03133 TaxID=3458060 RepID=UPI004043987E